MNAITTYLQSEALASSLTQSDVSDDSTIALDPQAAEKRYLALLVGLVESDDVGQSFVRSLGSSALSVHTASSLIRNGRAGSRDFPIPEFDDEILEVAGELGKSVFDIGADFRRLHVRRVAGVCRQPVDLSADQVKEKELLREVRLGAVPERELVRHRQRIDAKLRDARRDAREAGQLLAGTASPDLKLDRLDNLERAVKAEIDESWREVDRLEVKRRRELWFEYDPFGIQRLTEVVSVAQMREWLPQVEAREQEVHPLDWTSRPKSAVVNRHAMTSHALRGRIARAEELEAQSDRLLDSRSRLQERLENLQKCRTHWDHILI